MPQIAQTVPRPLIVPLGESALVVRFGQALDADANGAAIAFARALEALRLVGVIEIVSNLVSVLVRFDPFVVPAERLEGELRLALAQGRSHEPIVGAKHQIAVRFGGRDGPHLEEVAAALGMSAEAFVDAHNANPLRVLATGFAPGFVYCGFHAAPLLVERRAALTPNAPAGSVLFAAGQTAITATAITTGWHVIGRATFDNFDPRRAPPTRLRAGDTVAFEVLA